MSSNDETPQTIEEYYEMLERSSKPITIDNPGETEYVKEMIAKGCKMNKYIKPKLPPGYELVHNEFQPLIKNSLANKIAGPAIEIDNIINMNEFGLEFAFIIVPEEKKEWKQVLKPIKNFTEVQLRIRYSS